MQQVHGRLDVLHDPEGQAGQDQIGLSSPGIQLTSILASNREKLKWGKFGQLSNSATKAGVGECAGMNRRHEEKDLCWYLE